MIWTYHVLKNKEQHIILSYDFFELHNVWMVHPSQGLIKKISKLKRMPQNIIKIRQVAKQQSPSLRGGLCTLPKNNIFSSSS